MNNRVWCLAVLASLCAARSEAAAPESGGLEKFAGHWSCAGKFANGAPIAGNISMEIDSRSGALLVHHDDTAPGAYHSLEVWSTKKGGGLRASISDSFSGMRWFESAGWQGNALTWVRSDGTAGSEQFVYELGSAGVMQVKWMIARDGAMKVGDTLTCTK